jgi:sugar (pentulose or hexulose) kinase
MVLLGIDIGTTHCKTGLFTEQGEVKKISLRSTNTYYDPKGHPYYKPEEIWENVTDGIEEVLSDCSEKISAIGITSMAETGLLIDKVTGRPRTNFIPWFSRCGENETHFITNEDNPFSRFQKTGLHNSFKYALSKILWLRKLDDDILTGAIWLSASDFIAYMMTGEFGTDYTLAARTYAFRIDRKIWDREWLGHFSIPEQLFPEVLPSGTKIGTVKSPKLKEIGIDPGTPVAVSGHDHVTASLSAGAVRPGIVFDSIGTAETLVGMLEERELTDTDYHSGLSFGCHIVKNHYFWMGGLSSSGGSIEWFRNQFAEQQLSYEEVLKLSSEGKLGPTGILYYPYLSGSGSPEPDPSAKAAFIGVKAFHQRKDLLKAMMEGISYEMESIRRTAESITNLPIERMISVGGGTKNRYWMQIKSDITNCILTIPEINEATLLGAALTAGLGCGVYSSMEEIQSVISRQKTAEITPNIERHDVYTHYYEEGYLQLQQPLRNFYHINI